MAVQDKFLGVAVFRGGGKLAGPHHDLVVSSPIPGKLAGPPREIHVKSMMPRASALLACVVCSFSDGRERFSPGLAPR